MPDPDTTCGARRRRSTARRLVSVLAILCVPGLLGNRCTRDDLQSASRTATADLSMTQTARSFEPGVVTVRGALCCSPDSSDLFGSGGGDNLAVGRDESLAASVGYGRRTLERGTSGSDRDAYVFTFERVLSQAPVEFVYYRADNSKLQSLSEMPPDFEITEPRPLDVFDVTDDLVLEWTPSRDRAGRVMRIWRTVECLRLDGSSYAQTSRWQVPDTGQFIYPLLDLPEAADDDLDPSVDCAMRFAFSRETFVSIAPPYGSGSLTTSVHRAVGDIVLRL